MTRDELLERLAGLTDDPYARVAPYLEADLELIEQPVDWQSEIEAGLESERSQPLVEADEAYARVRRALRK